jgi:hypothetical protein
MDSSCSVLIDSFVIPSTPKAKHIFTKVEVNLKASRDCHGLVNPRGSRVRVVTGAGTGWTFCTRPKPVPVQPGLVGIGGYRLLISFFRIHITYMYHASI